MNQTKPFITLGKTDNLLIILGATATGKTQLAVSLARSLSHHHQRTCEIISADSRQVFRGMDIGTGKDLQEYGEIPYHLIDIVDPGHEFSVYEFQQRFATAFQEIHNRGHLPLLVGGTGLYMDAIIRNYQLAPVANNPTLRQTLQTWTFEALENRLRHLRPNLHNHTDLDSRTRLIRAIEIAEGNLRATQEQPTPAWKPFIFGLRWQRPQLRERITSRLQQRLQQGLISEVTTLLANGISPQRLAAYGLEYRFVCQYLQGEWHWDQFFGRLNQAIHKFAKRQETWFRRMERNGITIHWVEGEENPLAAAEQVVKAVIKGRGE